MSRLHWHTQSFLPYLVISLWLLLLSDLLSAHEIRPAVVDVNVQTNQQVAISVRLNLEALLAEVGTQHEDTEESANAQQYNRLRELPPSELSAIFASNQTSFVSRFTLNTEVARVPLEFVQIQIPEIGDRSLARDSVISLQGEIPNTAKTLVWQADTSIGANILRVNLAGTALHSAYLQAGEASGQIALQVEENQALSTWPVFANYVQIGFAHIIPKGLDHILFVVGLFLLSPYWRHLLWQVTAFTVAHSVTLALSILGWIQLPAQIVEPLIAASIVYICVENLLQTRMTHFRPIIVFAFGLLHGLGFASVLSEVGLPAEHMVVSLLAFNIGVELGQIAVLALCFLLVGLWFRQAGWYRYGITIPASLGIAAVGLYWFVERVA